MKVTESEMRLVLDEHADRLAALPNVLGVGIVAANGGEDDLAVAVYVRSKVPAAQLRASDVIPKTLRSVIGGAQVEVATRVVEIGEISF